MTALTADRGQRLSGALAVLALAGGETRRLLRHPALWGALVLYAAQWLYVALGAGDRYPVLHTADRGTQATALVLAAGVFVAVHMAVLRPDRDEAGEVHAVVVLDPWQRMAAHLLAAGAAAGLVAVLTAARIGYLAARGGAVGSPSVTELVTGPAIVLLAGALAVLVGCLTRSLAAGPLLLVVLGVLSLAGAVSATSSWRWLGLVAVEDGAPLPVSLMHRPAGAHLLYLLALALLCGAAALLLSGLRGRVVTAVALAALLGGTAAGAAQLRDVPASVAVLPAQRCTTEAPVTYCYFPDFAGRERQWARVTAGILRRVPEGERRPRYVVRQHVDLARPGAGLVGTPEAVVVGTDWGTGSDMADWATIGFSVSMAERLTRPEGQPAVPVLCGARAVVTLWLAAQATSDSEHGFATVLDNSYGGFVGFGPFVGGPSVGMPRGAADMARALLDRPRAQVAAVVAGQWGTLTSAGTSLDRAASLLGVRAPRQVEEEEGEAGPC